MEAEEIKADAVSRSRSSLGKIITIGIMVLIFLIPLDMVDSVINERQLLNLTAQESIAGQWGGEQKIIGPVLHLVYRGAVNNPITDQENMVTKSIQFLPAKLDINGTIEPEIRYRGIYKTALYRGDVTLNGHFDFKQLNEYLDAHPNIKIEDVLLTVGVSDVRGIEEEFMVDWGGDKLPVTQGARFESITGNGLTAQLAMGLDQFTNGDVTFSIPLKFKGSQTLGFVPVGKTSTVLLRSSWDSPSFTGRILPSNREVTENGFEAVWNVSGYSRNLPQLWVSDDVSGYSDDSTLEESFGVKLYQPLDHYQLTERAIKYAALFLVLTFGVIFVMETIHGLHLHAVQYLFVGSALALYYLLLLSFSEQISFSLAYLVASSAITLQIGLYGRAILKSGRHGVVIGSVIAFLYGMLYMLLQTADYTILIGSVGLFVVISIAMYATRNIDWYGLGQYPDDDIQGVSDDE